MTSEYDWLLASRQSCFIQTFISNQFQKNSVLTKYKENVKDRFLYWFIRHLHLDIQNDSAKSFIAILLTSDMFVLYKRVIPLTQCWCCMVMVVVSPPATRKYLDQAQTSHQPHCMQAQSSFSQGYSQCQPGMELKVFQQELTLEKDIDPLHLQHNHVLDTHTHTNIQSWYQNTRKMQRCCSWSRGEPFH